MLGKHFYHFKYYSTMLYSIALLLIYIFVENFKILESLVFELQRNNKN